MSDNVAQTKTKTPVSGLSYRENLYNLQVLHERNSFYNF